MTNKSIEILNVMALHGPNIWTYRPVIEAWVDIGDLEDAPSNTIPGFYERLTGMLPGLAEHRCGVGEPGGFLLRLREGTWPAHIMEHVMIELQNLAGVQTGFGKARSTSRRGVYKLVVRARYEEVSRAALPAARDLVLAAINNHSYDVNATVTHLRSIAESVALGPSTACIIDAARDRSIPSIRMSDGNLVQLGYGARQRRIWTAETDETSAIGESISSDKDLTKNLLRACGVPVPEGRVVKDAADAWDAAEDIGIPVVVKPTDGNHGRGVTVDLSTREQVAAAFERAAYHGSEVIVERFISGDEHRLLVIGGKVVAAARGEAAWVVGDGERNVAELIDAQLNSDPRRGKTEDHPLSWLDPHSDGSIEADLKRQGLTADDVPDTSRHVLIQRNGNVAFDVTDQVHPSVAAAASLATRIVGLDIAGVDLVAQDISQPLTAQGGAIVEVNAGPGLLMHLKPADGQPRPVGRAIVDHLFPEQESGRIPIVGVTGSRGKTPVARLIAQLLHLHGAYVGLTTSDGLFLRQRLVEAVDSANWRAAHRVLMNRTVHAAVFENGYRAMLTEGLAYDRCRVGVVTNIIAQDTLPDLYVDNDEQLLNVARTQVDVVLPDGIAVLNASDARVAELASLCDGGVIFFGASAETPAIVRHRADGGRAVFVRHDRIVLANGAQETALIDLTDITAAHTPFVVDNIMAAVAGGWALGIGNDVLQAGIETFEYESQVG